MDEKKCCHCKETKDMECFHRNRSRKDGRDGLCRDCQRERDRKRRSSDEGKIKNKLGCRTWYAANSDKAKESKTRWRKENPACQCYHSHKSTTKRRGIPWNLDKEWYLANIWDRQCAYGRHPANGGIDRVDSNVGYEPSNCVPCCFRCNSIKNDQTLDEMYRHIAEMLAHRNDEQFSEGSGI